MSIIHDAWLFDPSGFAETIAESIRSIADNPSVGYRLLQDAAVAALDRSNGGWSYAERYGGWDRASVLAELEELPVSDGRCHAAFCFTLLLYAHLAAHNGAGESLGLHDRWRHGHEVFNRLGCNSAERDLMIRGHPFHLFLERYLTPHLTARQVSEIDGVWECIHPASTGGHAGWLDGRDVELLFRELKEPKGNIGGQTSSPQRSVLDKTEIQRRTENMLQTAMAKNRGLCLILSG